MDKKLFITATEMAECLGVSKSHAYKIIKKLNDQLKSDGYMTVTGKTFWGWRIIGKPIVGGTECFLQS